MRTALCCVCLEFITADKRDLLEAARDHAIENLDTHRLQSFSILDVDSTAEALIHSATT